MGSDNRALGERLVRFRGYLRLLAELGINQYKQYRRKLDPSDIVQETLLKAYEAIDTFRGNGDEAVAAWLRKILAHNLSNVVRDLRREKRDVRRERSIEAMLDESSVWLEAFVRKVEPSPSVRIDASEVYTRVAKALAALPDEQREAVILKHWEGLSLADVSRQMGRSADSVAGLLRRGLKALRERLVRSV